MARTKSASKPAKKRASSASKKKAAPKREILYSKGTYVAIQGKDVDMNFRLAQVRLFQMLLSSSLILCCTLIGPRRCLR